MKTIKSFSDFDKSTDHVDEQLFKKAREKRREKKAMKQASSDLGQGDDKIRGVRGKEVYRDATGVKHKVVWKAQDTSNFIVKLVNDYNWLDANSNLTIDGQTALTQFLNGENSFVNQYGKLDPAFFQKNIIAYSVRIDNDRRQKIQFTILDRSELMQKQDAGSADGSELVSIDGVNYINIKAIMAIDAQLAKNQQALSNTIINVEDEETIDTPDDSQDEEEEISDEEKDIESDETDDIPVTDDSLIGKQFEYQSGADGLVYTITIDEGENKELKFWAVSRDGSNEGWVALKDGEPFWINRDGSTSAITNAKDIEFFKRIYTDTEYLKELIAAFEAKYPNGVNWTVKDILYYTDGNQIYAEPEEDSTETIVPPAVKI
jgi:hypothetical protein